MNTVTIKGVGVVHIPERNTKEEIIHIVNTLKDDVETLNEMLIIEPEDKLVIEPEDKLVIEPEDKLVIEPDKKNKDSVGWGLIYSFHPIKANVIWCLHEDCIEETEPFDSEEALFNHTCKYHLIL